MKAPAFLESFPGVLSQCRVLVAEDDDVNAIVIAEHLRALGCELTLVVDGAQAVAAVLSEKFDLVMLDCRIPVLDGAQAARMIRQNERDHASLPVPIVAVTASVLPAEQACWLAAGMDLVLAKPYTSRQLRDVVMQCMSRSARSSDASQR